MVQHKDPRVHAFVMLLLVKFVIICNLQAFKYSWLKTCMKNARGLNGDINYISYIKPKDLPFIKFQSASQQLISV